MEPLYMRYSHLKGVSESVIDFIRTEFWWDKDSTLKSNIEKDFGISGDDAGDLMTKFAEKYQVDLSEFDFERYFTSEGSIGSFLYTPMIILLLALFLIKTVISGVVYLFNKKQSKRIFNFSFTEVLNEFYDKIYPNQHESLTVEDLVTSVVKGKFTKRATVEFKIVK
ncbi:MAG: DUF1493 family protein [Cyclobacteriaceae bacterium]